MTDSTAFMSENFLPTFIDAYRSHRCLWEIKSTEYSNKQLKDLAYKDLVDLAKEVVPGCDVEFVKNRIETIRGSFRREQRKIQASMKSGAGPVHTPKLWYYKLLLFLSDQEEVRSTTSNSRKEVAVGDEENGPNEAQESIFNQGQGLLELRPGSEKRNVRPSSVTKRQAPNHGADKTGYSKKAASLLRRPKDEFDSYGKYLAAQLRRLDSLQNIYAQNIINQAVFQGLINKLEVDSILYTPIQYNSTPIPSNSDSGTSTQYCQQLMPTLWPYNANDEQHSLHSNPIQHYADSI